MLTAVITRFFHETVFCWIAFCTLLMESPVLIIKMHCPPGIAEQYSFLTHMEKACSNLRGATQRKCHLEVEKKNI